MTDTPLKEFNQILVTILTTLMGCITIAAICGVVSVRDKRKVSITIQDKEYKATSTWKGYILEDGSILRIGEQQVYTIKYLDE